jgi:uncharacterized protein DUF4234
MYAMTNEWNGPPLLHVVRTPPPATDVRVERPPVVADGLQMKRRDPIGVWIGLPLLTLGVYHLVWYYKIHKELAMFDRRRVVPVVGPMLVLLLLWWTVVAPLVSYYGTGKRIAAAQRAAGLPVTCSGGSGLLLMFVLGAGVIYYQSELNKVVLQNPSVEPGARVPLYV